MSQDAFWLLVRVAMWDVTSFSAAGVEGEK